MAPVPAQVSETWHQCSPCRGTCGHHMLEGSWKRTVIWSSAPTEKSSKDTRPWEGTGPSLQRTRTTCCLTAVRAQKSKDERRQVTSTQRLADGLKEKRRTGSKAARASLSKVDPMSQESASSTVPLEGSWAPRLASHDLAEYA